MGYIYKKDARGARFHVCEVCSPVAFVDMTMKLPRTLGSASNEDTLLQLARRDFELPDYVQLKLKPAPSYYRSEACVFTVDGQNFFGYPRSFEVCVTRRVPLDTVFEFMRSIGVTTLDVLPGLYSTFERIDQDRTYLVYNERSRWLEICAKPVDDWVESPGVPVHPRRSLAPSVKTAEELYKCMHIAISAATPPGCVLSPTYMILYHDQPHREHVRRLSKLCYVAKDLPGAITKLRKSPEFKRWFKDFAERIDMARVRGVYHDRFDRFARSPQFDELNPFEFIHRKVFGRSMAGRYQEAVAKWEKTYGNKKKKNKRARARSGSAGKKAA